MYKLSKKKIIFVIFGIFILIGLKFIYLLENKKLEQPFSGSILSPPVAVAPFSLKGIDNKVFSKKSLYGQWTIIFFGFTSCGYVCPTTLGQLAKMYQILVKENFSTLPKVVLVSIDPETDSLERLENYVKGFSKDFYAARGEASEIKKLAKTFGVWFEEQESSNSEKDKINHSGALMLIDPSGKFRSFFTAPYKSELLAKDFKILASNFQHTSHGNFL